MPYRTVKEICRQERWLHYFLESLVLRLQRGQRSPRLPANVQYWSTPSGLQYLQSIAKTVLRAGRALPPTTRLFLKA